MKTKKFSSIIYMSPSARRRPGTPPCAPRQTTNWTLSRVFILIIKSLYVIVLFNILVFPAVTLRQSTQMDSS